MANMRPAAPCDDELGTTPDVTPLAVDDAKERIWRLQVEFLRIFAQCLNCAAFYAANPRPRGLTLSDKIATIKEWGS